MWAGADGCACVLGKAGFFRGFELSWGVVARMRGSGGGSGKGREVRLLLSWRMIGVFGFGFVGKERKSVLRIRHGQRICP